MSKTIDKEVLEIIEEIVDKNTLWRIMNILRKKVILLSMKDDRDTLIKIKEVLEMAIKEEENEPMKPNYDGEFLQCPVCKKLLHGNGIWQNYCVNCVQKLDWSDEEWTFTQKKN